MCKNRTLTVNATLVTCPIKISPKENDPDPLNFSQRCSSWLPSIWLRITRVTSEDNDQQQYRDDLLCEGKMWIMRAPYTSIWIYLIKVWRKTLFSCGTITAQTCTCKMVLNDMTDCLRDLFLRLATNVHVVSPQRRREDNEGSASLAAENVLYIVNVSEVSILRGQRTKRETKREESFTRYYYFMTPTTIQQFHDSSANSWSQPNNSTIILWPDYWIGSSPI